MGFDPNAANHADPIRRRHSSASVIQATPGFSYKETTLFTISTVTQKLCFHGNFSLHCQTQARPHRRPEQRGPACRLLCHRELPGLSCGQGICASHTGLKATLHVQWSSRQGQCSGFPGSKLHSTPMPSQHEVLTSSQSL